MRTPFFSACCFIVLATGLPRTHAATLVISPTELQQIDGFGFFGPMQTWWSSASASAFYTPAWLALVVDSLGLTIWRNEYYSEESNQDANWAKQKPFVQALKAKADASGVVIKFIYTVWTPPSKWKSNSSLKNGGTLLPQYYPDFAKWLVAGVRNYESAGVSLYGLSPQNEPLFVEPYNSCVYTNTTYTEMLKAIGPIVHDSCPGINIFGPEHMLFGAGKDYDFANLDPSGKILADSAAKKLLDIWACHGYGADGVTPTETNLETQYWTKAWQRVGATTGKRMWMTETSGYDDDWASAMDYVESIHAAIFHGHASAWVHWYGAGDIVSNTALTTKGALLKHYARFVRPGARVLRTSVDDATIFCTAFKQAVDGNLAIVIINSETTAKTVTLSAEGLPAQFRQYQSTSSERCVDKGTVSGTAFSIPANSVVTLSGASGSFIRNQLRKPQHPNLLSPAVCYTLHGKALPRSGTGLYRQVMIVRSTDGTVHPEVRLRISE